MISIPKTDFKIATITSNIIKEISNILLIIPKKYSFQKNKLLYYSFDLLESIYMINDAKFDTSRERQKVITDIAMINFMLGYFIDNKLLSINQIDKILYKLNQVTAMTRTWFKNKDIINAN